MLNAGQIAGGGELRVGVRVGHKGDWFAECADRCSVISYDAVFCFNELVGLEQVGVLECLWRFHGPQAVALEVFELCLPRPGAGGQPFDCVAYRPGEGGSSVVLSGLVERLYRLDGYKGPGGIVDKDESGAWRQGLQGGEDRLLAGCTTGGAGYADGLTDFRVDACFDGGLLILVAAGDDGLLDGPATGKFLEGVEKDGLAGQWREGLVGHGAVHAGAAACGKEDELVHLNRVRRGWHGRLRLGRPLEGWVDRRRCSWILRRRLVRG